MSFLSHLFKTLAYFSSRLSFLFLDIKIALYILNLSCVYVCMDLNSSILYFCLMFCVLFLNPENVKIMSLLFSKKFIFSFIFWSTVHLELIFFECQLVLSSAPPGCSPGLKGEMIRHRLYTDSWPNGQWFGWMIRDLKGTWLENWWERIWRKGMSTVLSEWVKNMKIFASCVNSHLSVTLSREGFW